jgi:hypothetical protein
MLPNSVDLLDLTQIAFTEPRRQSYFLYGRKDLGRQFFEKLDGLSPPHEGQHGFVGRNW